MMTYELADCMKTVSPDLMGKCCSSYGTQDYCCPEQSCSCCLDSSEHYFAFFLILRPPAATMMITNTSAAPSTHPSL